MEADSQNGFHAMVVRPAGWLTIVLIVGWLLCFWPARIRSGDDGVWWMSLAAACSLVPGWLVVVLSQLRVFRNEILLMAFQATVRFLSILAAVLIVKWVRPDFGFFDFYGWLILFYLLALSVEVLFLGRRFKGRNSGSASSAGSAHSVVSEES